MFNKKKEVVKPDKVKITIALRQCKKSIQGLLDNYGTLIDSYNNKITNMKKDKRFNEAERYKQRLKLVLVRQIKMENLMDQVDQIQFMIDEAFAKNDVYKTFGVVLGEANKITVSPEIKNVLKDIKEFDDIFTHGLNKMDSMFGKITSTISEVDSSTSMSLDDEIEAMLNKRLENYDEQTTKEAEVEDDLFTLE